MVAGAAAAGMETRGEGDVEKFSGTVVEPQSTLCSQTVESVSKDSNPDGATHSRVEKKEKKKRRLRLCGRVLVCCLRKVSPVKMLRKFRDCYVNTLGNCAQTYVSNYPQYGTMSCNGSPLPPSLRMVGRSDDLYGSEFCLSPAFMKSFNESLVKSSGAFPDSDPGASPFRKSFSDFESCVSPQMQRTYSDAAALYSRSPGNSRSGCCRRSPRSPGWTPTRTLGGQAMMIFPIQEDPELILASFRKESHELKLASLRKENTESDLLPKKDAELPSLTEDTCSAVPSLPLQEAPETCNALTPSPIAV